MPRFPLDITVPSFDATGGMRQFGAYRKPTRLHAGCDLYAPRGTPVRAIADGVFQLRKYFDLGTDEVLIHHPGIGLVRYLEMMQAKHYPAEKRWLEKENGGHAPAAAPEFIEGAVKEGDVIGHVGELVGLSIKDRMLHFELYDESAVGENLRGYAGKGAYSRHPALLDPTAMLQALREGRVVPGTRPSGVVTNRGVRPRNEQASVDSRSGPVTFPDKRKPRRDEQVFARLALDEPPGLGPSRSWEDVATLYRSTWRG